MNCESEMVDGAMKENNIGNGMRLMERVFICAEIVLAGAFVFGGFALAFILLLLVSGLLYCFHDEVFQFCFGFANRWIGDNNSSHNELTRMEPAEESIKKIPEDETLNTITSPGDQKILTCPNCNRELSVADDKIPDECPFCYKSLAKKEASNDAPSSEKVDANDKKVVGEHVDPTDCTEWVCPTCGKRRTRLDVLVSGRVCCPKCARVAFEAGLTGGASASGEGSMSLEKLCYIVAYVFAAIQVLLMIVFLSLGWVPLFVVLLVVCTPINTFLIHGFGLWRQAKKDGSDWNHPTENQKKWIAFVEKCEKNVEKAFESISSWVSRKSKRSDANKEEVMEKEGETKETTIGLDMEVKPLIAVVIAVALTWWGLSIDSLTWSVIALIVALSAYVAAGTYALRIFVVALTGRTLNEQQNKATEAVATVVVLVPVALFCWGCFEADQQIRKDTDGDRISYNQMEIYQRSHKHNILYGWGYKYYYQHSIVGFKEKYAEFEKRMDKVHDLIER